MQQTTSQGKTRGCVLISSVVMGTIMMKTLDALSFRVCIVHFACVCACVNVYTTVLWAIGAC